MIRFAWVGQVVQSSHHTTGVSIITLEKLKPRAAQRNVVLHLLLHLLTNKIHDSQSTRRGEVGVGVFILLRLHGWGCELFYFSLGSGERSNKE